MTTAFLLTDLFRDEGCSYKSYLDSRGNWTNGVGNKLFPNQPVPDITRDEALAQLSVNIHKAENQLDKELPWWRQLSDLRQDVMVNIAFNIGAGAFATWHHTLADIEAGNFIASGIDLEHDEPWCSQVKGRATRLAVQMETNVHQSI